jgi:hypothetical protein
MELLPLAKPVGRRSHGMDDDTVQQQQAQGPGREAPRRACGRDGQEHEQREDAEELGGRAERREHAGQDVERTVVARLLQAQELHEDDDREVQEPARERGQRDDPIARKGLPAERLAGRLSPGPHAGIMPARDRACWA